MSKTNDANLDSEYAKNTLFTLIVIDCKNPREYVIGLVIGPGPPAVATESERRSCSLDMFRPIDVESKNKSGVK